MRRRSTPAGYATLSRVTLEVTWPTLSLQMSPTTSLGGKSGNSKVLDPRTQVLACFASPSATMFCSQKIWLTLISQTPNLFWSYFYTCGSDYSHPYRPRLSHVVKLLAIVSESTSIITFRIPLFHASSNPSITFHNSASLTVAQPMLRSTPLSQSEYGDRIWF